MIGFLLSIICIVNINGLQLKGNNQNNINNETLTDIEGFVFDSSKFARNYRPKTFRKLDFPAFDIQVLDFLRNKTIAFTSYFLW